MDGIVRMLGFNDFAIYKDNSTVTQHSNYTYPFALPFEHVHDKVGWTMLFQQYWQHSITVSIIYYIATKLMQWAMTDREPFALKRPLFLWNASLAAFSILGFVRFSEDFLHTWYEHGLRYSICNSCNPDGGEYYLFPTGADTRT